MEIKVEFISKELIKPSSPTPSHLRHLQFSFLDQLELPEWTPCLLFYSNYNSKTINNLKESLSKTLTIFYPLAGRLKDDSYVDCNDEGVLFVEAEANCRLSDILRNNKPSDNNNFIPLPIDDGKDFAAFIQITFLKCGGLAIAFTMSHKLGDGLSMLTFFNSWAAITRGENADSNFLLRIPPFNSATLFPPQDISGYHPGPLPSIEETVTKRFVFRASTLAALRAKYSEKNGGGYSISKANALTAFIWSRFMANQANRTDNKKTYSVLNVVNLRPRMDPPLSYLHFGNLTAMTFTKADMNAKEDGCYGIVSKMNAAVKYVNGDFVKNLQKRVDSVLNLYKERCEKLASGELVEFMFSSLCKFPIYEIDFGWGKPFWVASAQLPCKNFAGFVDTKEGNGIEAWITLTKEDMAKFEVDKELLAHVSSTSSNGNGVVHFTA